MNLTKTDKIIIKICLFAFAITVLSICSSCLGSKTVSEKTSEVKEVDKSEVTNDKVSETKVNKAIDDEIKTTVQPSGDPVLDAKIDAILLGLNTSKSSGDNSYKWYYDSKLRELRAEFQIGQTEDTKEEEVKETIVEKSFEENTDEYFKKKITALPWWAYIIAFFFLWPTIKPFVMMILGPTNIISSVSKIIKPQKE
jgi:aminopeptidase N